MYNGPVIHTRMYISDVLIKALLASPYKWGIEFCRCVTTCHTKKKADKTLCEAAPGNPDTRSKLSLPGSIYRIQLPVGDLNISTEHLSRTNGSL